jgi:hypothetical protein
MRAPHGVTPLGKLSETLLAPAVRPNLVRDCATLVDEEVGAKSGLSGLAIKAAYKVVKGFKPGVIRESVDGMLDDMIKNLDTFWDGYEASGKSQPFEPYASASRGVVADALLKVSDDRAAKTTHGTLKSAYEKLRPTGKKNVEEAVPRVASLVARYMK